MRRWNISIAPGKMAFMQTAETTPMMAQWVECKKKQPDAILFFQLGDFYEAFYEDAILLSKELDLTLTKRQETPMAGVPHHSAENYIERLLAKGYKVAVAEQVEDPSKVKGLVKREIVRIMTPGAAIGSDLTPPHKNNFFASLIKEGNHFGLSYVDLSTGEFQTSEWDSLDKLQDALLSLQPSECVTSYKFKEHHREFFRSLQEIKPLLVTGIDDWRFEKKLTTQALLDHFQVHTLDGFGLHKKEASIMTAGALLCYLRDNLLQPVQQLHSIETFSSKEFMTLDYLAEKHLELLEPLSQINKNSTLFSALNETLTPMGARLLRQWIKKPLMRIEEIIKRQEAVGEFLKLSEHIPTLHSLLEKIRDTERLISKIGTKLLSPRDFLALKESFYSIEKVKEHLTLYSSPLLTSLQNAIDPIQEMQALISCSISDTAPLRLGDGDIIKEGYSEKLDAMRAIRKDSQSWLLCYQTHLREQTGIKTLKVGFSRAFGYFIEVSKGQTDKMPPTFSRRQTLTNAERYISPELKAYESKVFAAEEDTEELENALFSEVRNKVLSFTREILLTSHQIAILDVLLGFAKLARDHSYVCPQVNEGVEIAIQNGRHLVIERLMGSPFTPNDTLLNCDTKRLMVITGPNMAGKSTYLRQVALIAIAAQMGAYIPATSAKIGLIDRIFTRIGASDDLSRGQSTFMVEMAETANILHHATDRSLVILDEIGRGTSTYDGISIAWAVAEYLLTAEGKRTKTLFATHYFELTKLEEKVQGAFNCHVAVNEVHHTLLFLHKIVPGAADRSFGIHVAKLAGMPEWVLDRSHEILTHLEENRVREKAFEPESSKRSPPKTKNKSASNQLTFL